jgi:hypothetical protein
MIPQDCAVKLEELRANKTLKTKSPDVPMAFMLLEAAKLYDWCLPDKEALIRVSLDWKVVEDLPLRIETLKSIETVWNSERLTTRESQKVWKDALTPAVSLKKELLHNFFYAYRNNKQVYETVQLIAKGNNYVDIIQQLIELSILGQKNPAELNAIHFDMNLLEIAREMSSALGVQWAAAIEGRKSGSENLILRNKAFYHLKEGMENIRLAGQFAFKGNKDRQKGYINAYYRRNNQLYRKNNKPTIKE